MNTSTIFRIIFHAKSLFRLWSEATVIVKKSQVEFKSKLVTLQCFESKHWALQNLINFWIVVDVQNYYNDN